MFESTRMSAVKNRTTVVEVMI